MVSETSKRARNKRGDNESDIARDYGLSENAYSFGYLLRLKYSSFMQETLNWFSENCRELLPSESVKVLSLGCGNGMFDLEMIKTIQQKITLKEKNKLEFTGLDFSMADLDQFHKSLSDKRREICSNITLMYKKFDQSTHLGNSFDLVTMIHFLHSFNDVMPIIKNALRHLSVRGRLLIVQSKKQGILEIKDTFKHLLPNKKFHCTDQIKEQLQSDKIDFTSYELNTCFDVSIMEKMSIDTLLLMSFCLSNDLSVLSAQQQDKIREAFLSLAHVEHDGRAVIDEPMEAIVCHL